MSDVFILQPAPFRLEDAQKKLFSPESLEFLQQMFQEFESKIDILQRNRLKRKLELKTKPKLQFTHSRERNDKTWKIGPLPPRLRCRRLDLGDVSPSNTAHFVDSLNADVQGIQVDFDDGHCPTWRNQILGYHNITQAVAGKLPGAPINISTSPVLMMRPRAWNMIEHNIMINGKEVAGPLVDFAILMFHNAKILYKSGSGPFFYLSKVEGASEAKLWNDIFVWTQNKLGIPQGSIKACVLIENIVSSFEMEEILFALKDHSLGLNCGIWDYAASIIAKLGDRADYILPDRNKYVNMDRRFLRSYMQLVISTCQTRAAPATGGMAAAVLRPGTDGRDTESKNIINKVLEAKLKEINEGVDGFMVYDVRLVPHVNELWKKLCSSVPNQISKKLTVKVTAEDLLSMPAGGVTLDGVKHNVAISILFVYHWLAGTGHFFYHGNVEDSATAEISRSQIWQWIRFSVKLEDGENQRISVKLIDRIASNFTTHAHKSLCRSSAERKRLSAARYMCMEIFTALNFPEFITSYLNDNHKFRTVHNKMLISRNSNL